MNTNKYFKTIIINGYITELDPNKDEWNKIRHLFLKGVSDDEFKYWLTECIHTIITSKGDTPIEYMEFSKEFTGKKNKKYFVKLFYN